jgi:hypothetical protein
MTETDLIMVEGVWLNQPINWETRNAEEIRFILNELEADDFEREVELVKRNPKPLTVTLFLLGSQVKQFRVYGQFVEDGEICLKSRRNTKNMIINLILQSTS